MSNAVSPEDRQRIEDRKIIERHIAVLLGFKRETVIYAATPDELVVQMCCLECGHTVAEGHPPTCAYYPAHRNALPAALRRLLSAVDMTRSELDAITVLVSDRPEAGTYAKVEGLLAAVDATAQANGRTLSSGQP